MASFAARGNYNHFEESQSRRHSNGRVVSEHEPAWKRKRRSKHKSFIRCFVCDSTMHVKREFPHLDTSKENNRKFDKKKKVFVKNLIT